MRVEQALQYHHPARPCKFLSVLVVLCLMAHAMIPLSGGTAGEMRALMGQAMGTQTVMMEFFSFSALPLMLIGNLMKDADAGVPARSHKTQKNDTDSDGACVISFDARDMRQGVSRSAVNLSLRVLMHDCAAFSSGSGGCSCQPLRVPSGPPGGWFLIVLVFFILLPRSGIDGDAVRMLSRAIRVRFAAACRAFYFAGEAV